MRRTVHGSTDSTLALPCPGTALQLFDVFNNYRTAGQNMCLQHKPVPLFVFNLKRFDDPRQTAYRQT